MTRRTASWYEKALRDGRLIAVRGSMVVDGTFKGPVPLNRSQRWKAYYSYQKAREMGPSAEPVR